MTLLLGQKKISTLASCLPKDPPKAGNACSFHCNCNHKSMRGCIKGMCLLHFTSGSGTLFCFLAWAPSLSVNCAIGWEAPFQGVLFGAFCRARPSWAWATSSEGGDFHADSMRSSVSKAWLFRPARLQQVCVMILNFKQLNHRGHTEQIYKSQTPRLIKIMKSNLQDVFQSF